jgi:hypothetical protein
VKIAANEKDSILPVSTCCMRRVRKMLTDFDTFLMFYLNPFDVYLTILA